MKLAVIGSRSFNDYKALSECLSRFTDITAIVSGGAKGADSLAERYAFDNGIETIIFIPDWKRHGRGAGMIRNKAIVSAADVIVAFWDGTSKGTKNSIELAKKAGKRVIVHEYKK